MLSPFWRIAVTGIFVALAITPAISQTTMVPGEVRRINESTGKITLRHGPIKSLGMDEGMTMVFRVRDPEMLNQVKVGDKVEFEAENTDSGITITKMQKAK